MKIKIFKSDKTFINESVKFIFKICKNKKSINIALSGGDTPKPIYEALANKNDKAVFHYIKQKINFYQVDERYVPKTDSNSNYKMINETLVKKTGFNFYHFDTSLSIKKSLAAYSKHLPKKPFDLTILGIGPDGHIASLFPNSKALTGKKSVAHTTTTNFAIKDRLTLTFPPILKSKNVLILLTGQEKLKIIETLKKAAKIKSKITKQQYQNFPALKLLQHKNLTIYFS